MMKIQGEFDPLAVVIDWLDACRSGGLVVLLDLYDDLAILECDCERVSLTGRHAIAAYWALKLETKQLAAFTLDNMALTDEGVRSTIKVTRQAGPIQFRLSLGQNTPHAAVR